MSEPIKLCVILEGGLLQNIFIAAGDADVYVIDHDISDAEEYDDGTEELSEITFGADTTNPSTEKVFLWKWEIREPDRDPKFLLQVEKEYEKKPKWVGGGQVKGGD